MNHILCGDAVEMLQTLPTASCRCCVTSPPYYGLRDYGCAGQIGLEQTPEAYIAKLVEVFRAVRRVLTDDGTLWINIADSYAHDKKWGGASGGKHAKALHGNTGIGRTKTHTGLKDKDLIGIPWLLAFALRADGWYLRQEIIWHKPNCMPESVRDRCTKSHESIFLLSKSPRYYFDADAIKEPVQSNKGNSRGFRVENAYTGGRAFENQAPAGRAAHGNTPNTTGLRNKRDVWTVATAAFKGPHFATFPPDLIRPCVLAGSAPGDTVLDPFFGAGTTGLVAWQEGRAYIGVELHPDNCKLARRRIEEAAWQMRLEAR